MLAFSMEWPDEEKAKREPQASAQQVDAKSSPNLAWLVWVLFANMRRKSGKPSTSSFSSALGRTRWVSHEGTKAPRPKPLESCSCAGRHPFAPREISQIPNLPAQLGLAWNMRCKGRLLTSGHACRICLVTYQRSGGAPRRGSRSQWRTCSNMLHICTRWTGKR